MKNQSYECPPAHDGEIPIYFDKILMPYSRESADLLTPSVPSPKSYKHLQLVQKNLAWSGVDIIGCWNLEDGSDAVIYLGKWDLPETTLEN
jgi:hypothetical protein